MLHDPISPAHDIGKASPKLSRVFNAPKSDRSTRVSSLRDDLEHQLGAESSDDRGRPSRQRRLGAYFSPLVFVPAFGTVFPADGFLAALSSSRLAVHGGAAIIAV